VKRCLTRNYRGEPEGGPDVAAFLQFAVQLVFCERLFVTRTSSAQIAKETEATVSLLRSNGISNEVLTWINFPDELHRTCAERAAARLEEEFELSCLSDQLDGEIQGLNPNRDLMTTIGHGVNWPDAAQSPDAPQPTWLTWMSTPGLSAVLSSGDPTFARRERLLAMMRYRLNEELAVAGAQADHSASELIYSPAPSRCRMVWKAHDILKDLNDTFKKSISGENAVLDSWPEKISLDTPALALGLVLKCKGDPTAVISEALKTRAKTAALRDVLSGFSHGLTRGSANRRTVQAKARKALTQIAQAVNRELGLADSTNPIIDPTKWTDMGFGPVPSLSNIPRYWQHFRDKRRFSVLIGFAQDICDWKVDQFALRRLVRNMSPESSQA
jgi:hypothetical protein